MKTPPTGKVFMGLETVPEGTVPMGSRTSFTRIASGLVSLGSQPPSSAAGDGTIGEDGPWRISPAFGWGIRRGVPKAVVLPLSQAPCHERLAVQLNKCLLDKWTLRA